MYRGPNVSTIFFFQHAKEISNFEVQSYSMIQCRKSLKRASTVVVIASPINAKDTLFPEKVAKAKKMLRKATFLDPRFGNPPKS
jgi:hypothetical protein